MEKNDYYYTLIHDQRELATFHERVMPPLLQGEVYFLSLSARAKYLSTAERESLQLGRAEMFSRSIVRNHELDRFLRSVRKYEVAKGGYTTKNGSNIPEHAIVVYANINPSHTLKAYLEFQQKMTEYMKELAICAEEGRKVEDVMYRINKMDTLLMNCYQRSTGTKHYVDVDFDIDKSYFDSVVKPFLDSLTENGALFYVIDTRGGYHVMISRRSLNYNYTEDVYRANENIALEWMRRNGTNAQDLLTQSSRNSLAINETTGMEAIVNKSAMVPLPGALQGGYPVTVLWEYSQ